MLNSAESALIVGLGLLWLGLQILWVAPTPRQLRRGQVPTAAKGTPEAFQLFWIDQYGWIGIALSSAGGLALLFAGLA